MQTNVLLRAVPIWSLRRSAWPARMQGCHLRDRMREELARGAICWFARRAGAGHAMGQMQRCRWAAFIDTNMND
jgi:hypothetical protein